jgi:hypothetical protein
MKHTHDQKMGKYDQPITHQFVSTCAKGIHRLNATSNFSVALALTERSVYLNPFLSD